MNIYNTPRFWIVWKSIAGQAREPIGFQACYPKAAGSKGVAWDRRGYIRVNDMDVDQYCGDPRLKVGDHFVLGEYHFVIVERDAAWREFICVNATRWAWLYVLSARLRRGFYSVYFGALRSIYRRGHLNVAPDELVTWGAWKKITLFKVARK